MSLVNCAYCGEDSPPNARFCVSCGKSLDGVKGTLSGIQKRIRFKSKEYMNTLKNTIDDQVNSYLTQLDKRESFKIAGITIPDDKRDSIRNALLTFKEKYGDEEISEEYQEWLDKLPEMMKDQKCIICFGGWENNEDLVVCKHCQSGGHRNHLEKWVKSNHSCPLCRNKLKHNDLISIKVKS